MVQKELLTQKDYAAVGGEISHKMAKDFTSDFEAAYPGENPGYHLGRNIIEKILAQPGCVGMRFYYGLNTLGEKTLVYTGMDANGYPMVNLTMVNENGVVVSSKEGITADLIGLGWPFR